MVLVKTKIVFEKEGDGYNLTTYMWKKWWWIFGYWYPFGCMASNSKESVKRLASYISNEAVSKVIYDNFIHPQPPVIAQTKITPSHYQ